MCDDQLLTGDGCVGGGGTDQVRWRQGGGQMEADLSQAGWLATPTRKALPSCPVLDGCNWLGVSLMGACMECPEAPGPQP